MFMFMAEYNRAKHVSIYKYISGLKSFTFTRFIELSLTVNIYILIALLAIIVATCDCVCYRKWISSNDKRPVTMNSLRLFISAFFSIVGNIWFSYLYNMSLDVQKKWIKVFFLKEILLKLDNSREYIEMNNAGYPISLMLWSLIGITYTWYYTKSL
jgi:hypothetical protein